MENQEEPQDIVEAAACGSFKLITHKIKKICMIKRTISSENGARKRTYNRTRKMLYAGPIFMKNQMNINRPRFVFRRPKYVTNDDEYLNDKDCVDLRNFRRIAVETN
ncbi:hypothetical protein NQ317_011345 [Molorchus minor]|uniref:Uncharacterized protein n=1 Tax=Molorchus minor TaxID=1323400 RepID=A0ABQ9IT57_9CUCU|nr:hypothetical protein NQ317_011345 [Molorchus minor]